jgi:transcription termination/antitermination protein NusG
MSKEKNIEKIEVEEVVVADAGSLELEEIHAEEQIDVQENKSIKDIEESKASPGEWYIVQCYSGQEYKVRTALEYLIEESKLEDKIFRVLIPEEETIEIKNNKRKEKVTKIFPGYVFVQMLFDEDVCYLIRRITGVAKFIGTKNMPVPVKEAEILKVLRKVDDNTPKIDVDFEIDEVVKVVSGPFRGYAGSIAKINSEKGSLKTLISVFGRDTPVVLSFDQVEKINK